MMNGLNPITVGIAVVIVCLLVGISGVYIYHSAKIKQFVENIHIIANEINEVINECNDNVEKYNTLTSKFDILQEAVKQKKCIDEMAFESTSEGVLDLVPLIDVERYLIALEHNSKRDIFRFDAKKRFEMIDNYFRTNRKTYIEDINEWNFLIRKRTEQLRNEWECLLPIIEKLATKYPECIHQNISKILDILLSNRIRLSKLDIEIQEYQCEEWNCYE